MAPETVYAELQAPGAPGPRATRPRRGCSRSLLRISVAGNVVLAVAAAALGALAVSSRRGAVPDEGACEATLGDLVAFLQPRCRPRWSVAAGDSSCDFCPRDWFSHGGECYWVSAETRTWPGSRDDCARKQARLAPGLGDELELLNNHTQGTYPIWISSTRAATEPPPSRPDGNRLEAAPKGCWVLKGRRPHTEVCSAEYKWVCRKAAFRL